MDALLARAVSRPRFVMTLLGVFAVVAAVLSAAGLYGVVAYAVQQRTREVGVRIALGARPSSVVGLIAREGVWLIALGIVLGAAASGALARLLSSFLYGVSPYDPVAFTVAPVLLAAVAVLAIVVPARRASRVDPVVALRAE